MMNRSIVSTRSSTRSNTSRTFTATALASTVAALGLLAGCDTAPKLNDKAAAPVETRNAMAANPGAGAGTGASTAATPQSSVATVDLSRNAAANTAAMALPSQRVVYFDYDSYAIKDDYKTLIDAYARVLSADKSKKVVIEGHTDERGGREYNLALGQKRAAAVVQAMALLGASESQMEAVSFGQERPAVQGNDESAWSKNRRAEVKDR